MIFVFWIFLSIFSKNVDGNKFHRFDPLLSANFYLGRIKENEQIVQLEPILNATDPDGQICGFELSKFKHDISDPSLNDDLPFKIDENGLITVKEQLDCEKKEFYRFYVRAFDCENGENRRFSERSTISIHVEDLNEFDPIFTHDQYVFKVFHDGICSSCRVEATDDDCSNVNGRVCGYKILDENLPFSIDANGTIQFEKSFTENLFEFEVFAIDCQTLSIDRNQPARVTIKKIDDCKPKIYDPQATKLIVDSDHVHVFETTHLEICDETCATDEINGRFQLQTDGLDISCENDQCELDYRESFLLKEKFNDENEPFFVSKEDFDGNFHDDFLLRFSMKNQNENLDEKQEIFCLSDEKLKNRHHLSLFVENDRLKLLIRKQIGKTIDKTIFPAEWSWKIDQINDDQWHSYKIFVNFPSRIDLYVDDEPIAANKSDFEIIRDYGLPSIDGTGEKVLVVGACWHARAETFVDKFNGELSSISIEQSSKSSCLRQCNEFLEISELEKNSLNDLTSNSNRSEWIFRTDSVENFENILKHVVYRNVLFPLAPVGQRIVSLQATIKCLGENSSYKLTNFNRRLSIDEQIRPVEIQLKGDATIYVNENEINAGIQIFSKLSIFAADLDKNFADITDCSVSTSPEFSRGEKLILPDENGQINDLEKSLTQTGLILSGAGSIESYQSILQQIIYVSKSPIELNEREFSLVCIGAHDHIATNDIRIRVKIDRSSSNFVQRFSDGAAAKSNRFVVENDFIRDNFIDLEEFSSATNRLSGWPLLIVLCISIGLASTLVLYLVVRIRQGHQKRRTIGTNLDEVPSQMEWEDEIGLNIIVNPLDEEKKKNGDDSEFVRDVHSRLNNYQDIIDDEYENDEFDCNEEENSSEEEEEEELRTRRSEHQLEWDDAALQYGSKHV